MLAENPAAFGEEQISRFDAVLSKSFLRKALFEELERIGRRLMIPDVQGAEPSSGLMSAPSVENVADQPGDEIAALGAIFAGQDLPPAPAPVGDETPVPDETGLDGRMDSAQPNPETVLQVVEEANDTLAAWDAALSEPDTVVAPVQDAIEPDETDVAGGVDTSAVDEGAPVEDIIPDTRLNVLLAEDNATNRLVFRKMVAGYDLNLRFANNGQEAVDAYIQERPDIIFMDISMPIMDGKEATQCIRDMEPDGVHTPIIAVTAHAVEGDRESILEAGLDDYLTKPVRKAEITAKLTLFADQIAGRMAS